jgi:hypothetical protein
VVLTKYQLLTAEMSALLGGIGLGLTCPPSKEVPFLVSATASPGQVDLVWDLGLGAYLPIAVERRSGPTWREVWRGNSTGQTLHYTDRNVRGGHYEYRVALNPDGRPAVFGEFGIDVPRVLATTLNVLGNPTPGSLRVQFEPQSAAPALVEVFDLRGRLVASRRLGFPSIGGQVVDLGAGFENGLYVVRVRQGGRSASAKAVIVR